MHPAFSVIFLTTLIGAGQGLFLALFAVEVLAADQVLPHQNTNFYVLGSVISLLLLTAGLGASFFHLGRPERAWRAASQWRTSWLSREVIMLPIFMFMLFLYGVAHLTGGFHMQIANGLSVTVLLGLITTIVCIALFICTGMIYACLKFLQEWHTPFTPINYSLLGIMSGFMLATAYASVFAPQLTNFYAGWTMLLIAIAFVFRFASLMRNNRIKQKSSAKTALGIRHTHITQKTTGGMGGSFNTREFFHGKTTELLKTIKYFFLIATFVVPLVGLWYVSASDQVLIFSLLFLVQYIGLIAERWFFFAQANHPQNIYYQSIT